MLLNPVSHTVLAFSVFFPAAGLALALQDSRSRPSASMTSASVMNFLRFSVCGLHRVSALRVPKRDGGRTDLSTGQRASLAMDVTGHVAEPGGRDVAQLNRLCPMKWPSWGAGGIAKIAEPMWRTYSLSRSWAPSRF